MSIRAIFLSGVETAFNTFSDAVKPAEYSLKTNTGFESTERKKPVRVIKETFTQEDIKTLSFADQIQPKDIKGLVPFVDLAEEPNTGDTMAITDELMGDATFAVVAFAVDPMTVLFTLLLRAV